MTRIQSLDRGLRILGLLTEADADPVRRGHGVPLGTLAAELDVHKTTALRLVQTLVATGYAESLEARGGYRLGPAMRRDRDLEAGTERLKRLAHPFLEELVVLTGECAHTAVADAGRVLVIDDVETDQPLRVVPSPGRPVPFHCTSAGKVLLAFGMAEVPAVLPARTPRTITTHADLEAHLATVRHQGFALDDEENDIHTRCISAPVFGTGGTPIGCIGIDAPSVRLTLDRIPATAASIVDAARRLSLALGAGHPTQAQING